MKKGILVFVLLALMAVGAFAMDISAGGGALMDLSFNNGVKGTWTDYWSGYSVDWYGGIRNMAFGGFFFLDFTYAEIDVSIAYGAMKYVDEEDGHKVVSSETGNSAQLGFSLLLKYPIVFNRIVFFPFGGINYNLVLSMKENGYSYPDPVKDFSQFGLYFGVGLDNYFSDNMYFRIEAGLGLRFASKFQKDQADLNDYYDPYSYEGSTAKTTLGVGPRLKIGIGRYF